MIELFEEEYGYIGNIWVRQNYFEKKGDKVGGHVHYFDHVSILAKGSVKVTIDNDQSKEYIFNAPTFIVIKKEHRHEVEALEDDTSWYCVFAARDIDGDVTEIVNKENMPWFSWWAPDDFWEKRKKLESLSFYDTPHNELYSQFSTPPNEGSE